MQLMTQVIGLFIWLPFFRRVDNEAYEMEQGEELVDHEQV